jgi:benzoylformate decarboxylase
VPSVREAAHELFRRHGMTTVFGNPGSTELPMLAEWPADFTYVLGLQEAVVVGMADGYAQASRRPALVNLHTAPGVGNAMGAILGARESRTPLVITAGQQVRAMMTLEALLTSKDATTLPRPAVKWAYEPPRARDVPAALTRAIHLASLPPKGPVLLSLPMDDWAADADEDELRHLAARTLAGRVAPDPEAVRALAARLVGASSPALVVGGDVDASGGFEVAVALAERARLPVLAAPTTGGGRVGFPEDHANFQGILPPAIAPASEALAPYDLVVVAGAAVFAYYPYVPGPLLPEGASLVLLTSDPDEAARAPMGDAVLGDVALALGALLELVGESDREPPPARPAPEVPADSDPMSAGAAMATLAEALPADGVVVNESPSNLAAFRDHVRPSRPGSSYFSAGGGLGFGLPAAIGIQMAEPERPVVAVIGDGSAQYAIAGLWSAVTYRVPVTFLILRNEEYAILKWFGEMAGAHGAPGLDVGGLDSVAIAGGYGMRARRAEGRDELREALGKAIASQEPELIEVPIAPGASMS